MLSVRFFKVIAVILCLVSTLKVHAQEASPMETYIINPEGSNISFDIDATCRKSDGGYTVRGRFMKYEGNLNLSTEAITKSNVQFTIDMSSIQTSSMNKTGCAARIFNDEKDDHWNKMRDEHLKSADFFDTQSFQEAKFRSISVTQNTSSDGKQIMTVKGKVTWRGLWQNIDLTVTDMAHTTDESGRKHISIKATTAATREMPKNDQEFNVFKVGPAPDQVTNIKTDIISIQNPFTLNMDLDFVEATK